MSTLRFHFLTVAFLFLVGSLRAQNGVSNLDVALTEQRFDAISHEALAPFFDPGTYRVSVRLTLAGELVSRTVTTESATDSETSSGSAERLPALPFYQRGVESEIRRPEPATEPTPDKQTRDRVSIRSMLVFLWLSDELTDREAEFAERVVREALKLDVERGDRLSVQRESMPVRRNEAGPAGPAVGSAIDSVRSSVSANVEGNGAGNAWWIALLSVLIAIGSWIAWRYRSTKASVTAGEVVADETEFTIPALPAIPTIPQAAPSASGAAPLAGDPQFNVGRVTLSHLDNRIDAMEFLLHVFMVHAEEVARLMESWIQTDSIAGTERVVDVLLLVDPKFLSAFKAYMSAGVYQQIERTMAAKSEMGVTKRAIDVLETMAQDVKKRFRVENGTVRLIALQQFDFVNHIEDKVLVMLLDNQSAETCALVLYHLDSARASGILSALPRELAEETLLLIPLVRGMEFAVYDRIAKQVFDSYHEWMRSQSLVTKGLMQTVFILESLTEAFRVPYLDTMAVVDPVWSAKVRQHLITEENLDGVPDELLRPVVSTLNLDRLSVLLAVCSDELVERMTAFRTPREQVRLRKIRLPAEAVPEELRRRELSDLAARLRQERAQTFDSSAA